MQTSPKNHTWKLMLLIFTAISLLPACANAKVGDFSNDGAFQRDNGLRGELILNGSWRWQPVVKGIETPNADKWLFRNVPGYRIREFFIRDKSGRRVSKLDGKTLTGEELCWQEREFTLPANWKGRKVILEFYSARNNSVIYLDGKKIGELTHVHPGEFILPEPLKFDRPYRLTVKTEGIYSDVWLRSYQKKTMIEDDYLITSFRQKHLQLKATGFGKAGSIRLSIAEDEKFTKPAKPADTANPIIGSRHSWSIDTKFPWANPKIWSQEHPNLYWYKVELLKKSGRAIDATLPRRFGFREFWIKGGDFMLNDKPVYLNTHMIPAFKFVVTSNNRAAAKTRRFVREYIRRYKDIHMNALAMWGFGETQGGVVFDVLDETGMITYTTTGWYKHYRNVRRFPKRKVLWEARTEKLIKRYRHHPSIVMWDYYGGSQVWDYCPGTIDGSRDPEKDWPIIMRQANKCYRKVSGLYNEFDGTRPILWHSSESWAAPVVATMGYLGFDFDLQERENWPFAWDKTRHKPIYSTEFGMPYYANWKARRKRGTHKNLGTLALEYSAMYFGDKLYRETPDKQLPFLSGLEIKYEPGLTLPKTKTKALFTRQTIQAWRTYGISLGIFAEQRYWYDKDALYAYYSKGEDPRRPGSTPDQWDKIDSVVGNKLNEVGVAAKEVLTPLYIYIGGDRHFTGKDHSFYAGEKIVKRVVAINDHDDNADIKGSWELIDDKGNASASGKLDALTLKPGRRSIKDLKISFNAPDVRERAMFTLKVKMQSNLKGRLSDEMTLDVFPRPAPLAKLSGVTIYCYDPKGDTRGMLKKLGVAFKNRTAKSLKGINLTRSILVIGRHCLEKKANVENLGKKLDVMINNGLRVIVFEQATENMLGVRLEKTAPRQAFIRAAGHPVFKGLRDCDMKYWRGDSDLVKPYDDPLDAYDGKLPAHKNDYPKRLWHWGNDHIVATYVIKKPQVGACRALIDCGFDLMETPLLETVKGKGRIIFCQLDVTNRYSIDPAATRIVNNIFTYMSRAWSPKTQLTKLVAMGAKGTATRFRWTPTAGPISWGISAADLHFRSKASFAPAGVESGNPVLYTWVKDKGRKVIGHTLNVKSLKSNWHKAKVNRIHAALRINQGGTSIAGPSTALHGDDKALYPIDWLEGEGFVHPYLHFRW